MRNLPGNDLGLGQLFSLLTHPSGAFFRLGSTPCKAPTDPFKRSVICGSEAGYLGSGKMEALPKKQQNGT